jgi:mono/diheme cytochrome c family protein
MNRIRVAFFESSAQAEPVRLRLLQSHIPAEVHQESPLALLWYISRRRAGARLEVRAQDAERAGQLLLQWDADDALLRGAIRCPECKSLRVDFPQFTQKSVLTNLALGLVAEMGLLEREYYCEDCHCMWEKQTAKSRRPRQHLAPDYFLEDVQHELPSQSVVSADGARRVSSQHEGRIPLRKSPPGGRRSPRLRGLNWGSNVATLLLVTASACALAAGENAGPASPERPTGAPTRTAHVDAAVPPDEKLSVPKERPTYLRDVLPILMGKCARCHNDQSQGLQNWLDYRTAAARRWDLKRRVWDSWKGAYFKQPMPTANSPESTAMTDEERALIRDWVTSGAACGARPSANSALTRSEKLETGKRLFSTICSACHQPAGQGIPGRFPPLAGSDFLNADKHRAIKIVVNGLQGEVTVNGQTFNSSMPRFPLSDEEVASALTYVYSAFGNSGKEVTPTEVGAARREKDNSNLSAHNQSAKVIGEQSPYE